MNRIFAIFILLISLSLTAQTIEELEYDLSWYDANEEYGEKIAVAGKLQQIDPFNEKAIEYICRYYYDRKIDSVSIFFNNLISAYPDSPTPYLIRSKIIFLEVNYSEQRNEYFKKKEEYLKTALKLDNENSICMYYLAENYYNDFIYPLEKDPFLCYDDPFYLIEEDFERFKDYTVDNLNLKLRVFEHPADSALKYFYELWDIDIEQRDVIYFSIRQLECYLKKRDKSPIILEKEQINDYCFFPSWYFADLKENWECDFTTNYLFEIEKSKSSASNLEEQLSDLNEICLYNKDFKDSTIFRFTWLRSFHNPISIRVENNQNEIFLYWKVGKGAGGYKPEGLKNKGKKVLNRNEWDKFLEIVEKSKFDKLSNNYYIPSLDGATWTLEKKTNNKFKAHKTNFPNYTFQTACLYLLNLTDIEINEKEIY